MLRLYEVPESMPLPLIQGALGTLATRHDALRLRVARQGDDLSLRDSGEVEVPVEEQDLRSTPADAWPSLFETEAEATLERLDLFQGPIFRAAHFQLPPGQPSRLLLVLHHLAVDIVSWQTLEQELEQILVAEASGSPKELPPTSTSFLQWARRLDDHAHGTAMAEQTEFWLPPTDSSASLPLDHPGASNTIGSARTVTVALGLDETRQVLRQSARHLRALPNEVVLAAVALAFREFVEGDVLWIEIEGHGREDLFPDVDLEHTVGWFSSPFPLGLSLEAHRPPEEVVRAVQDRVRSLPDGGIGHGLLRYKSSDPAIKERLAEIPRPHILFNYLGHHLPAPNADEDDSPRYLRPARESIRVGLDPREVRFHLLDLDVSLVAGELHLRWRYSEALHHRSTIETWGLRVLDALRKIADALPEPKTGTKTEPSAAATPLEHDSQNV